MRSCKYSGAGGVVVTDGTKGGGGGGGGGGQTEGVVEKFLGPCRRKVRN